MRIAQIAPLWESVPAPSYGGTELVIDLLTNELIALGHDVTLFAPGSSKTQAHLEYTTTFPLRELIDQYPQYAQSCEQSFYPGSPISIYYELQLLNCVFTHADQFDVIHNHLGFITLPFADLTETPVLTTLHGAFRKRTLEEFSEQKLYHYFSHLPYVSISNYQRTPLPNLNYAGTVYHGLDLQRYDCSFTHHDKSYLAFLGRFCKDKGPDIAIQVAKATGWNLVMAGKVDSAEEIDFFNRHIQPYIDNHHIKYIGELNHPQKVELLKNAAATLCPVTWPEPFGLVLIESMACGTPVIALHNGSIPEIIKDGQTGYIVQNSAEMQAAIQHIGQIDRQLCRDHVEQCFSHKRMAQDYLQIYQTLVKPGSLRSMALMSSSPPPRRKEEIIPFNAY